MNNKIRVLVMSEGSFLNTGYGKYAFELISRLYANADYEVAELAAYGTFEKNHPLYSPNIEKMPWTIFPNIPSLNDKTGIEIFNSGASNEFGRFRFEQTCLEFKPDVVLSFRDYWMDVHIDQSPYRRLFKWVHMPTVDAEPQKAEWLDAYARADALLTYSDWAIESLKKQNFVGNVLKSAPPAGTEIEVDKAAERQKRNIPANAFVVGTVMRNQPRKLYDKLFEGFAEFAKNKSNVLLYCHAGFPDVGWNLPELMVRYGISDKVVFTYSCDKCGHNCTQKFSQSAAYCPRCGNGSARLVNTKSMVSHEEVSRIISTFDIYCQIANSEGFGLPQVEAASVGVPVMATDYSAMADVVRKLNGFPIDCHLHTEVETGCLRATPIIESMVDILTKVYRLRQDNEAYQALCKDVIERYRKHYNWLDTYATWDEAIKKVYRPSNWQAPPMYCNIPDTNSLPQFKDSLSFIKFCYDYVLCRSDLMYSYEAQRTLTQLNCGSRQIDKRRTEKLDGKKVLDEIIARANHNNFWESKRVAG